MRCACGQQLEPSAGHARPRTYHVPYELYGVMVDCACGSSRVLVIWTSPELADDLHEFRQAAAAEQASAAA